MVGFRMPPKAMILGELERLPRGRHGLSRAEVEAQQRTRILAAMVDVVAERGFAETRVVDVITAAGVSRKTFYELFDDKESCFLAAFDVALEVLLRATRRGYETDPSAPWPNRVRLALAAFLEMLANRPAAARFCLVEVLAAGPRAVARRDAAMRQFTGFIDAGRAESSADLPGITSLAVVGGLYELLYSEILHGATASLPMRLPELIYWIVHPFLGDAIASEQRELASSDLTQQET
jgi:AcrR family transcriptional regulator